MRQDPLFRRFHHNLMTFGMLYAFHENFILPLSHDEVVHGKGSLLNKMPGDEWQKFANLRAYIGFMWGYSGKKLLFMGCEFGQWQEWNHDLGLEWAALDAPNHQGLQRFVRDLNLVYRSEPALHENDFDWNGFSWVDTSDSENSVFSYIRYACNRDNYVIIISNLTPVVRQHYRVGVPRPGRYHELINSDKDIYWGSGQLSGGELHTLAEPAHGHGQSLVLTLPPLSTLYLKPV
jgi:1,4-alpha-glucan branching enzyme